MPPFPEQEFRRIDHVYHCPEFSKLLNDAIRFFNGTPVHTLPPPRTFNGAGVYAIYCTATEGLYQKFGNEINQLAYNVPIYVGKAVPEGWRQSRNVDATAESRALSSRLRQHATSIREGAGLKPEDFFCRFVIFEGATAHMIAAVEAALIAEANPLWNSVVDGFGNHNPGKHRANGQLTAWDTIHPGRAWTRLMTGEEQSVNEIKRRVKDYMIGLRLK